MIQTKSKIETKNFVLLDQLFSWKQIDVVVQELVQNPKMASVLTCRSNLGTIITNGTAILGLGNIGALQGLPVMEGKSVIFKHNGGTDIMPMCIQELDCEKFLTHVQRILPIFSIVNLEDIRAPECFIIENALIERTDIPIFHDDQHGTAVVILAGLINALQLKKTDPASVKLIMNGAGAAGLSVTRVLLSHGFKNIVICDTVGAIYSGRPENMNDYKEQLAKLTNLNHEKGTLKDVIKGADVFVGVSGPKLLTKEMVMTMNPHPIVFGLANPTPEIHPDEAYAGGALTVATGRSDLANQINNSLAFPGLFRAAIDMDVRYITLEMKVAAAKAIAGMIKPHQIRFDYIIP